MKKLFTLLMCLLFVGVGNTFAAEDIELSLVSSALMMWGGEYDDDSQTFTDNTGWGGCGWWLNQDYEGYAGIQVEFSSEASTVSMTVQYDSDGSETTTVQVDGSDGMIYVEFKQTFVYQISLSVPASGDAITFESAKIVVSSDYVLTDRDLPLNTYNGWGNPSYDTETHTMTLTDSYGAFQWWYGDVDDDDYDGVEIIFTTPQSSDVVLAIQYTSESGTTEQAEITSTIGDGTTQERLYLAFNKELDHDVYQIYVQMNGQVGDEITFVSAKLVAGTSEEEPEPEPDPGVTDYELPLDGSSPAGAGYNYTYDTSTHTITITGAYGGYGWWFNDVDEDAYDGAEVVFTAKQTNYVQLIIQYADEGTISESVGVNGIGDGVTEQRLYLAFNKEHDHDVMQIYVQGQEVGDEITLVSAKLLAPAYLDMPISDSGTYATYYDSQAYTMPDGLVGYTATGVKNGVLTLVESYKGGDTVPMGVALLIQGEVNEYTAKVDHENPTAEVENMFYGSDEEIQTYGPDSSVNYLYYMLSYDTNGENLGFYWGADNGVAFTSAAHKAWLAVPEAEGANLSSIAIKKGDNDSTGISSVESEADGSTMKGIYTVQGVRVSNMNQPGLYIVDGKKVLVK